MRTAKYAISVIFALKVPYIITRSCAALSISELFVSARA